MVNGGMTFHDVLFAIFVEGYGTVFYVVNPRLHIQVTNRGGHVESSQIDPPANSSYRVGGHKHYTEASILVRLTLR